jgi:hypothetical protein
MTVEIHGNEAVKLQKPPIDVAHHARIGKRHSRDDVAPKPIDAARLSERVHGGGVDAGVDRAAHQHHGTQHIRVSGRLHDRDRRHHRHRWLAYGDHMHVAAEEMQSGNDVIDVVVEIELPFGDRHHTGVDPFGEVDVVIGEQRFDGAAQQRRVVPRHWRHDQKARLRPLRRVVELADKMREPAERALLSLLMVAQGDREAQPNRPPGGSAASQSGSRSPRNEASGGARSGSRRGGAAPASGGL